MIQVQHDFTGLYAVINDKELNNQVQKTIMFKMQLLMVQHRSNIFLGQTVLWTDQIFMLFECLA